VIRAALARIRAEDPGHACRHVCVEPYEQPWLEELDVELLRARVETLGPDLFRELGAGDILFIDSSHVIRPQGDVLFEILLACNWLANRHGDRLQALLPGLALAPDAQPGAFWIRRVGAVSGPEIRRMANFESGSQAAPAARWRMYWVRTWIRL